MDAAAEMKSQVEKRLDEQRLAFAEERRALEEKAGAAAREAADLKGELRRRVETELAQARAALDSERGALFAAVEAERENLRAEAKARAEAERARLQAVDQSLKKVESMRAEQSAERARILSEVHSELNRKDPPALQEAPPAAKGPPHLVTKPLEKSSPPPAPTRTPHVEPSPQGRPWLWAAGIAAAAPMLWWLWTLLP